MKHNNYSNVSTNRRIDNQLSSVYVTAFTISKIWICHVSCKVKSNTNCTYWLELHFLFTNSPSSTRSISPCLLHKNIDYRTMPHFDPPKIYSCGKHCEKRRNCLKQAISPFFSMFSTL